MGFKDWLEDKVDRIANFRVDRQIARDREHLTKRYGFVLGHSSDEFGAHGAWRDRVWQLHAENRLPEFQAIFNEARALDVTLPNAMPLHEALVATIMSFESGDPEAIEATLAPFRKALHDAPSPFQAALLARAVCIAAYAYRGDDVAVKVQNRDGFDRCMQEAQAVLLAHPEPESQCPLRARAQYELVAAGPGTGNSLKNAFEQAWQLDPYNLALCERHGVFLLPRWFGRDARNLETFARQAAARTEDRFGMGAYAFIYSFHPLIGSHDAEDTLCDAELLRRGFEDLIARFDGQSLLNRYAPTMDWTGAHETVYRLFHEKIHVITRDIWSGDTPAEQMEDALEAFVAARYARTDRHLDRQGKKGDRLRACQVRHPPKTMSRNRVGPLCGTKPPFAWISAASVLCAPIDHGAGNFPNQRPGVDRRIDRLGWPRRLIDAAANPASFLHRMQGLRQGPIRNDLQCPFDLGELAWSVKRGDHWHGP